MPRTDPKEVQVARINARQAIVVALISAVTGMFVTLLGTGILTGKDQLASPSQQWLSILSVDLDLDSRGRSEKGVRVIAEVNGRGMSYPTRDLWGEPNPKMPSKAFLVEQSDQYRVRLEVLAIDADGLVTRFISQQVDTIAARQLPVEKTYELFEEGTDLSREGAVRGRVKYRLSDRSQ